MTNENVKLPSWLTMDQKRQWYSMRQAWRKNIRIVSNEPEFNSGLLVCVSPSDGKKMLLLIDPDGYVSNAAFVGNQ